MKHQLIYLFFIGFISCNQGVDKQKESTVIKEDIITKEWFYKQFQKDTSAAVCLVSKTINKLFFIGNKTLNLDTGWYYIKKDKFYKTEDVYIIDKTNRFKDYYQSIFFEFKTLPNSLELIEYNYQCKTDSFNNSYENTTYDYYFKNDSLVERQYNKHSGDMYFPYKNLEEFKKYIKDNTKGIIIK
ncbi:MAG: hypothetical protein V4677_08885 [Bacteroidota bacterium]